MSWSRLLPAATELVPWTDRRGRFNTMRALSFGALMAPGLYLAARWLLNLLGPEPVTAAIHSTGYYAVWILLASLVVSPWKALAAAPNVVVLRRMMGNAALIYALIHLGLYAMDQQWRLGVIVMEIVKRFYLTIGFGVLVGLLVLGVTSTDGWARHLGGAWKRLHRTVYVLTALGLFHYILQSKLDVSHALLAAGVFAWLMLWRVLPAGRDRAWPWLLLITAGAGVLTLGAEYLWYGLATRISPVKVVLGELDLRYGLHPADQVLLLGLAATLVFVLRRASQTRFGAGPGVTMLAYGLGGLAGEAAPWFFGWELGDAALNDPWPWARALVWVVVLAALGRVRWQIAEGWQRRVVDGLWVASVWYEVVRLTTDDTRVVTYGAAVLALVAVVAGVRLWPVGRVVVLMVLPLAGVLAYQAALA